MPELQAQQDAAETSHPPVARSTATGATTVASGVEVAERRAAFLPAEGSEVAIFEDAGHFLHLETRTW